MQAFANAIKASLLDMALYFVGDWRKVGAAEAFLAGQRELHSNGSFEDLVIEFTPDEKGQQQYNAAATALRRLIHGYTRNARSTDPTNPPVKVEGRYPEFVVLPLSYATPTTYDVKVKDAKGKTVVKTRNARKGILLKLAAATVVADSETDS